MNQTYQSDKSRVACGTACLIPHSAGSRSYFMIKRSGAHGAGKWSVPGGWVAKGEDPEDAIKRECWEEVGIVVNAVMFLGYTHDLHDEGVEDVCLWFRAIDWSGHPRNTNPDRITEVAWMTREEIFDLPRSQMFLPLDNLLLKEALISTL